MYIDLHSLTANKRLAKYITYWRICDTTKTGGFLPKYSRITVQYKHAFITIGVLYRSMVIYIHIIVP